MIITLLVILLVAAAVYYIISVLPLPSPVKQIAYAVCALILLIYIVTRVFHVALP